MVHGQQSSPPEDVPRASTSQVDDVASQPGDVDQGANGSWGRRARRAIWFVAGALTFLYALATIVPWALRLYVDSSLDVSWELALHHAFAVGMRHGHDILFTFGPYGFLFTRAYTPATVGWTIALWTAIGCVLWSGIWLVARRAIGEPVVAFFWAVLLLSIAGSSAELTLVGLNVLTLIVFFTVDADRVRTIVGSLLCAAVALSGLVKFTYFVVGVAVVVVVAATEAWRGHWRRGAIPVLVYLGSLGGFWLLAAQRLGDFPVYIRWSLAMTSGYSDAMSVLGRPEDVGRYLALAGILLGCLAIAEWRARHRPGVGLFLGVGLILFVAFKAGFVRHDLHVLSAALSLLLVAASLIPEFTRRLGRVVGGGVIGVVCILAATFVGVSTRHYLDVSFWPYTFKGIESFPANVAALRQDLGGMAPYQKGYESAINRIRATNPIPPSDGPVDLYSYSQAAILVADVEYAPRLVFQSYAAFTPELAERNAAHVRGDDAPQRIYFDVQTIDARYPSLDDGASWPDLLTRYDVRGITPQFLVLERASHERSYQMTPLGSLDGQLGKTIAVPPASEGPLWVRIDLKPTLLGRLADVLYKRPQVYVDVVLTDGQKVRYRLVPAMARGGFLLSPIVVDRNAFVSLASGQWRKDLAHWTVSTITVVTDPSWYSAYAADVDISVSRLDYAPQDLSTSPEFARSPLLDDLAAHVVQASIPVERRVGPNGGYTIYAHAPSRMELPLSPAPKALTVEFGMLDGSWRDGGETDGVEFRISRRDGDRTTVLWSRRLDPRWIPQDRGQQSATIDLDATGPATLVFETVTGESGSWDWSYWGPITAR